VCACVAEIERVRKGGEKGMGAREIFFDMSHLLDCP